MEGDNFFPLGYFVANMTTFGYEVILLEKLIKKVWNRIIFHMSKAEMSWNVLEKETNCGK